jgi:hypothetical protein
VQLLSDRIASNRSLRGPASVQAGWPRRLTHVDDEMRIVIAGGLALLLFLLIFAFGQFQEIFRAAGGY